MPSRVFTEGIGHTNETVSATVDSSGNLVMAKDIKLPAAGGIKTSGGAVILNEAGGNVSLGDVRLPTSGGIKDSSGNNLVTESGGKTSINLTGDFVPSNSFMFRNKIINGNFDFWQRGTSQTSSSYGSADRWACLHVGSSKTASQQSFTNGQTDVPNNPRFYFRHVVTSSSGNGNYVQTYQAMEDVTIFAGKTVTLSFYAKADSNKNIATEFTQWFGTGGSPSSWNTGLSVTTHNLTTSWQKFTVTTVIPSISGKTIGSDANTSYTGIYFHFDAGSNFNARTNSLGQQSGTFDIAQVQIEEGSSATPFEHRPAGVELSLCQRYYEVIKQFYPLGMYTSGSGERFYLTSKIEYATEKRAQASITITADSSYWTVPGVVAVSASTTHTFTPHGAYSTGHSAYSNRHSGNNTPSSSSVYLYEASITHKAEAEL